MIKQTNPPTMMEFVDETYDCYDGNLTSLLNKITTIGDLLSPNYDSPKHPLDKSFDYRDELKDVFLSEQGRASEEVLNDLKDMLGGSIRGNSELAFFNILTAPLLDTVAAGTVLSLYNSVTLTDGFAGKLLLYEQKIARMLGRLVGWEDAYGISCSGGKLTLLYAIKSAISRIAPEANRKGLPTNLAIITNEGAHYSVEHVCAYLGLGSGRCFRVPCCDRWHMDQDALSRTFENVHEQGLQVAAVICCAGTTINFVCDNVTQVADTIRQSVERLRLDYMPYLHVDSVIGWLCYSFLEQRGHKRLSEVKKEIAGHVEEITKRLREARIADSFGVDLHKNGLCPFSTSFFVTKHFETFNGLGDGCYEFGHKDLRFGKLRPYRYTIENSRPATGIASAWIALQRLGISGLNAYFLKLKYIRQTFIELVEPIPTLEVLNRHTLGWEIVFSIHFSSEIFKQYQDITDHFVCTNFIEYLWEKNNRGDAVPLISIVPGYQSKPGSPQQTAFLFFPMLHSLNEAKIHRAVNLLLEQITLFEKAVVLGELILWDTNTERPAR